MLAVKGGEPMTRCASTSFRFLLAQLAFAACLALAVAAHAQIVDEAMQAGRSAQSLPPADEDYFHDMDGGVALTPDEVKGRNMWLVWTGGDDRLWDKLTNLTFGAFDLLKILSSSPGLKYSRDNRWTYLGLVNEPCFSKATGPNPDRYGLWLDVRSNDCPPDPFENAQKYPGVAVGARGKNIPLGSFYGYPTGIVGLRLFPQSGFRRSRGQEMGSRAVLQRSQLLSVEGSGAALSGRHVLRLLPCRAEPGKAARRCRGAAMGESEFDCRRAVFLGRPHLLLERRPVNFLFQMLHTARPGSLDTSLVSSDNINNPRTMNAVYNLWPRLEAAKRWGRETLGPDNLANKQFNDFVSSGPLTQFFQPPNTVWTPHVLKDGSDSVGALGALNRVYVNIGLFSEEWLRHFNPVLGGKPITPFEITTARKNSSYWQATEMQSPAMALFLVKASYPHKLRTRRAAPPISTIRRRRWHKARSSSPTIVRPAIRARRRRGPPALIRPPASVPIISIASTSIGRGRRPTAFAGRCARS